MWWGFDSMRLSETLHGIGRPIAYLPRVAKCLGGVKAGVLFCQLFYWSERAGEMGWFWKSQGELADETGLTIEELRGARKELTEKGVVESRYDRLKHRLYFRIDRNRLDALWATHNDHIGKSQMADGEIPDGDVGKSAFDQSNSEITPKSTQISERNGNHSAVGPESETEGLTPEDIVEAWNEYFVPMGMPKVTKITPKRRADLLAKIREFPDPPGGTICLVGIESHRS